MPSVAQGAQCGVDIASLQAALDAYSGPRDLDRNGDGWRELPDGKPLVLEYGTQPDQVSRQRDELLRKDMQRLGLRIEFKTAKWPEQLKAARAGKLQMWSLGSLAAGVDGQGALARLYGPQSAHLVEGVAHAHNLAGLAPHHHADIGIDRNLDDAVDVVIADDMLHQVQECLPVGSVPADCAVIFADEHVAARGRPSGTRALRVFGIVARHHGPGQLVAGRDVGDDADAAPGQDSAQVACARQVVRVNRVG